MNRDVLLSPDKYKFGYQQQDLPKNVDVNLMFFFVSEMIQTSNFPGLGHDQVEKNSLEEGNCNHFSELIPELFFFS